MVKQKFHIVFILLILSNAVAFAQKPVAIKLDNPSFEDYPQAQHVPQGWFDCGFASETPPDIQPGNFFQVTKKPQHGITYVGMVVRDNNTWEAIAQRLKTPIMKGVTYTFSVFAARSELYVSRGKTSDKEMNYTTPVVLRIWGGSGFCTKDEMLGETEPVMSGTWTKMNFKFTPKSNYTHLMIEAFYKTPTVFPYNGNVMIDNASDIVPEEKDKPIAAVKPKPVTPKPTTAKPTTPKPTKVEPTPSLSSNEKPHDPKIFKPTEEPMNEVVAAKSEKFKEGQIMKIEKLQFKPNSTEIEKESYPQLDQVYNLLVTNPSLVVEIGGHTNLQIDENMADNLSTERARAVYKYLTGKGIDSARLVIKGYGKSKPLVRENSTAAHKINQRVEIKILSTNG